MDDPHLACVFCGKQIDTRGPGVCQYRDNQGAIAWGWVAFIEDWRGGYVDLIDPVCFAEIHGVDQLVLVVHERDETERGAVPRLVMEIDDLRRRLGKPN